MKFRSLIAILALLSPMAAHAWTCASSADPDGWINTQPGQECYMTPQQIAALYGTGSNQAQSQTQGQHQGQAQTAGGGAGGTANATGGSAQNAGNSQTSASYESVSYPRQNPGVALDAVQPFSCKNVVNLGGSTAPLSLGIGISRKDPECDRRMAAAEFRASGRNDLAIEVLCTTAAAKGIANCAPVHAAYTPLPGEDCKTRTDGTVLCVDHRPAPGTYVTPEQLRQVEQRMDQKRAEK